MRRRIRLTGRKQIARADAPAKIIEIGGKRLLTLVAPKDGMLSRFPANSRVLGILRENKLIELVELGTLGDLKPAVELQNTGMVKPRFQLRIVSPEGKQLGLLLGSTDSWTLEPGGDRGKKGILYFQSAPMEARAWRLEIQEDDYPIVYVNDRIPDAGTWAKTDPTFVGFVFPSIVALVFDDILSGKSEPDTEWMKDWLAWADSLMPGYKPPYGTDLKERREWSDRLIDSFSSRYRLADKIVAQMATEGDPT